MTVEDDIDTHATLADSGDTSGHQELSQGSNLGRYVIIEPIGSGGMGTVYRAYDPQLNRGVALKILSVKHADLQEAERAKARLIREAQALAQLSHPNVVAVHDAGAFGDDVFIAMELVEGKTLGDWLIEEKRSVKEILEVMSAAGRGLSAAHKVGLVHRDFKPGNVIVGDDSRVRVLDFGLARAADQQESTEEGPMDSEQDGRSQESKDPLGWKEISSDSSPNLLQSPLTKVGGVLGTPLYMAPEQHLGLKTDERTDQFGFCVVLYEALYGRRPFSGASMEELKREVIRHQVCVPSADTEVPSWLWQIVCRGLSVKPEKRYSTIDLLLEDLDQDPEEVRRQKGLARRRKLFVISMIVLMVVVPIGVWYSIQYRTFQLCKSAEVEFEGVWDKPTKALVQTAFLNTNKAYASGTWERVERTIDHYIDKWTQIRSDVCEAKLIRGTQSEELFDLRMSCLRKRVRDLNALMKIFAEADCTVVQKAVQASESLTDLRICIDEKALLAPYPPPKSEEIKQKVTAIRNRLAQVRAFSKTGKFHNGLELVKKLRKQTSSIAYRPVQAEVLYWLGILLEEVGDYKNAEISLHDAAKAAGDSKDALLVAKTMIWLMRVVGYKQAQYEEGLLFGRYAEVSLRLGGGDNITRAELVGNLGIVFAQQGKYDQALESFGQAHLIYVKELGPEHTKVAGSLNGMGVVYRRQGQYTKALENYSNILKIYKKALGANHPSLATTLNNMGLVYWNKGDYDKALESYHKALAILKDALGTDHHLAANTYNNIGNVYHDLGEYDKALEYLQKSLAREKKALGPKHPAVAKTLNNIGNVLHEQGNHLKALECYRKSLTIREMAFGLKHPSVVFALNGIGNTLIDLGRPNDALQPLEKLVNICGERNCDQDPHGYGLFGLARALASTGKDKDRAIKLAKQAREIFTKTPKAFKKKFEQVNTWLQKHKTEKLDQAPSGERFAEE